MFFGSGDGILARQCLVSDINVFSRIRLNTTTRNVEYDGGAIRKCSRAALHGDRAFALKTLRLAWGSRASAGDCLSNTRFEDREAIFRGEHSRSLADSSFAECASGPLIIRLGDAALASHLCKRLHPTHGQGEDAKALAQFPPEYLPA